MSESSISRQIVAFLRGVGCKVYVTSRSDPRGRHSTAGLPDVIVFHRRAWCFAEIKTAKGKVRPDQEQFEQDCDWAGVPHQLWRSLDDAKAWARVRLGVE